MKEFGGYLPIEDRQNDEYYMTCRDYEVRYFNSGRSAIYKAFEDSGANSVWLPVYLYDSVREFLDRHNIRVKYYNVDT